MARVVVGLFLFLALVDSLSRIAKLRTWARHGGDRTNPFTAREASGLYAYNIFTAALALASAVALCARDFW